MLLLALPLALELLLLELLSIKLHGSRPTLGSLSVAPVSSVRIGETRKDYVKSKACVDYPKWVALFVGRSEAECKKWLDKYQRVVLKLCIPYEVR
jgi:hypothetical protein